MYEEEKEKKEKENPLIIFLLILFILAFLCAGIGYNIKNMKTVVITEEIDGEGNAIHTDINDLGSSRTIVRIDYYPNDNFYGCYKTNCAKLDLNDSNYIYDMRTDMEFDDNGESGEKIRVFIDNNTLKFSQSGKTFSLPSFSNPEKVFIMGDKKNKQHLIYILNDKGELTKISDKEFANIGNGSTKINTTVITNMTIKEFSARNYASELEIPEIDIFLKGSDGNYIYVNNNVFDVDSITNSVKYNNDFTFLNYKYDNSDEYNFLKYNDEILTVTSMFNHGDEIILVDNNHNIYHIVQNKIDLLSKYTVSCVKKDNNKILVTYSNGNVDEYDFTFDRDIYLDGTMYVNFGIEEE